MGENERLHLIRKKKGLTLKEFGTKIGITDSAVSQIEKGRIKMSEQTRLFVCREFGVNEEWLRDGTGEMFTPQDPEQEIATFLGKIVKDDDDSLRKRLISALAKLDESDWAALAEMVRKMKKDPEP